MWEADTLVHTKGLYYNATYDSMSLDYYGTRLKSGTIQYYHDAALTVAGTFKEKQAAPDRWLIRTNLTCTGWYVTNIYFSDGSLAVSATIEVEEGDLVADRCESDHTEPTDQEKEDEENGKGIGSESGSEETACWTKICECIAQLNAPLNAINNSIQTTNSNLGSVNNNLNNINNSIGNTNNHLSNLNNTTNVIKDVLTDFRDEFKTNIEYTLPENPSVDGLLENNKPGQNEIPFVDDNIYFKDEGDAPDASPGKLPKAPEPKHWEGFLPEPAIPPEVEKETDLELDAEDEKLKDEEIIQEIEIEKDIEKVVDTPLQTDIFHSDDEMNSSEELKQNLFFNQTNIFSEGGK